MQQSPHDIAERRLELSSEYFTASEQLESILERKPSVWLKLRALEGIKSDKAADRAYEATEDGIHEMKCRLRMKRIEKKLSASKTFLEVLQGETKMQY